MIHVCDIVEYGLDCFNRHPQSWRVTHHLKRVEDGLDKWKAKNPADKILKDILLKEREKERNRRKKLGLPCNKRYKLVYCRPKQATHVSLVGISGCEAPISECKKVGKVNWNKEMIKEHRQNAVGRFWLSGKFHFDWEWE